MYPDEDKMAVCKYLTKLLLALNKVIGNLGKISNKNKFPSFIAADNPRPIESCFLWVCEKLFPNLKHVYGLVKMLRDVFHIQICLNVLLLLFLIYIFIWAKNLYLID